MNKKVRILSSIIIFVFLVNLSPPAMSQTGKIEEKLMDEKIIPGNITIDFQDADIRIVLRVLSEKSGINIVASKDVEGRITIRLTNVHWERVLDMICKNYGYAFEREGNIIRVTTIENLKQEELTTEVFTLNYGKANEVMESVKEMLTERGKDKIKYDGRTNLLIVTDIPTNLYRIRQVIEKLDRRTPQVLIEAKIIETTLDKDENLGIDWSLKLSAAGASRPTTLPFEKIGSRILGFDTDLGKYLPVGKGAETVGAATETTGAAADFPTTSHADFPAMPLVAADQFTFGTLDFSQFAMVMEFLKARRDTKVLSNPRIATLNNQEAAILIGEILAIPTFERNPDTGTIEITGYTERDLGVKLSVTPHINEQGDIVVNLKPEISDLLGFDILDAARGIRAPRYSAREAETQVMVRNGQTIMIGGLIKEKSVDYEKKVPWLGDIPVLGKALFTKTEEGVDRTELMIFMTVHIIGEKLPGAGMLSSSAFVPVSK
ncbi:MAG: secretin N-terminal domain-containing protein [Candidatus Omnitrophota bacterium]|nr:secretin N-terminal domain-containing protein [Candidatus Omnitrophota bacterium]